MDSGKSCTYWFSGFNEGYCKVFEIGLNYKFIKGKLNISKERGSIIKFLIPLSKVLGVSLKEAKDWVTDNDGNGWFTVSTPKKAIELYEILDYQIEFKAITVYDDNVVKVREEEREEETIKSKEAWAWYRTLSDIEKDYIRKIQESSIAIG